MSINKGFGGVLRINPAICRYFTDDSGKTAFLTGSHTCAVKADMRMENKENHSKNRTLLKNRYYSAREE